MGYENNLTDAARKKGREKAHQLRRAAQNARRVQVKIMRAEGKSKAEIARHFGVSWETINRDCQSLSTAPEPSIVNSIIDAVFTIVRKEIAGEMKTAAARAEVAKVIELHAEVLASDENS